MENCTTFATVAQQWTAYKRQFVKQSTMSAYMLTVTNYLLPHFGSHTDITETDVQHFVIQQLDRGLRQKTVKDQLIVLNMIYRFGCKHGAFVRHD